MNVVLDNPSIDDAFAFALPPRPYPGLRAFDDAEWPIFYGRERMVDAVVAQLVSQHLAVVHGDSGSGKSSLIRAGVLPRLRQEQARGGARWRTVAVMPRGGPLRSLARALAALDGRGDDAERVLTLRRALNQGRRGPAALAELLLSGPEDHLCILIDQFEELFEHARLQGPSEARLLTDALVSMADSPPSGLYVAVTMRSEYMGACARFPGLAEAVNVHQYLLPPMAVPDLLRAIREPARLYGGEVDLALAERMAVDAGAVDGLPLVQHALMLMQRENAPLPTDLNVVAPWRLTPAHYPEGGLAAQLSGHADTVARQAQALAPARERLVEDLFRSLSTINAEGHAVRRPQPLSTLAATLQVDVAELVRVIEVLRADGVTFLLPREGQPLVEDDWIDISHEALIRSWQSLSDPQHGWLGSEFRNGLVWRALLVQAESFERDPDNVLSPATTEERLSWMKRRNPVWTERYGGGWERVQALLAASVDRQQEIALLRERELAARVGEARARRRVLTAGAAAGVALALGSVAVHQWLLAAKATEEATRAMWNTTYLLRSTEVSASSLSSALTDLRRQALEASSLEGLKSAVLQSSKQFDTVAENLTGAAKQANQAVSQQSPEQAAAGLRPLIYVHYPEPAQADAARQLQQALSRQRFEGQPLDVPGTQRVDKTTSKPVLRCFHAAECGGEAQRIMAMVNGLLAQPTLVLDDASATFERRGVRARQYELWFTSSDIRLAAPIGAQPPASR